MTDNAVLLGIDLGTSAAKAIAVTPSGEVIGRGAAPYRVQWIQEGWAEQDPEEWWSAVAEAVRAALGYAGGAVGASPSRLRQVREIRVLALGLSGQVNGIVPIDSRGHPLRQAIIWLDQRARAEADHINCSASDLLRNTTFVSAQPIHAAAKLLWLLRWESERMRQAWKILFPKDFITYRLTKHAVTDVTDAGASLLLDLRLRRWATSLFQRLHIPPELLPEVVESPTVVGTVLEEPGEVLGIEPGTPVIAGAGDMAAITVGTGMIAPGLGCAIIGTAGQVALFTTSCPEFCPEGIWVMPHPMPSAYFWHGLVMTAGYCITWLGEILGIEETESLSEEAERSAPGSGGLIFLPFLDGAATPYANSEAKAVFFGLRSTHRRSDLVRAVMEGVAYNFRDCFEVFASLGNPATRIRIAGGGSRSRLWRRILADVLGVELDLMDEQEASALGAAVIASVGSGVYPDFATACEAMVKVQEHLKPEAVNQRIYSKQYMIYQQLFSQLQGLF